MFENYSFGDLLSNIYKKRILNLIAFLLLSIALVCPLVLQTINKKTITKEGVQYSTYVAYKITAPESDNINGTLYGINKMRNHTIKVTGYMIVYLGTIKVTHFSPSVFSSLSSPGSSRSSPVLTTVISTCWPAGSGGRAWRPMSSGSAARRPTYGIWPSASSWERSPPPCSVSAVDRKSVV